VSVDHVTLYAHNQDGSDEYVGWLSTLASDPDGDDIAMGVANSCLVPIPLEPINPAIDLSWTLTLAPASAEPITLDPEGTIRIIAHLGASGGTGTDLAVTTALRIGETIVAEGAEQAHSYEAAGDGEYATIEWELTPAVTELPSGQDLVWELHVAGDPCSTTSGPFLSVSEERGVTRIELPATNPGAGSAPIQETIEGEEAVVELTFDESSDAAHAYAWNATDLPYDVLVSADSTNGSAVVTVTDAANKSLLEAHVGSEGADAAGQVRGTAGTWTIHVQLSAFEGDLVVRITPIEETPAPEPPSGSENGTAQDNGTALSDDGGVMPSTGFLVILAAGLVALAAVRARRRR
jgi:hypothetical protein